MPTEPKMYLNGRIVDYADCRIHAFASVVKYGTGVFEGLRAYWNDEAKQLYVFRLREHMERIRYGMKAMRYADIPPLEELERAIVEVSRANAIRATTHYRMIAFLDGDDELATTGPTGIVVGAVVRGSSPRIETGMAAMISSYVRIADNAMPPRVKCTANYVNNRAAELEARGGGYESALMLTQEGKLSEATGGCVFLIRKGRLITPDLSSDILESITRETIIELARTKLGLTVEERRVDRSELTAADEIFACGSGWEVIPITSVGRVPVGDGAPGPGTRAIQKTYFDVVHGRTNAHAAWLTPVW